MSRPRPAVLAVETAPADPNQLCYCPCAAVHAFGVCVGSLAGGGVRVHVNSRYCPPEGVPICRPCAEAWPELTPGEGP